MYIYILTYLTGRYNRLSVLISSTRFLQSDLFFTNDLQTFAPNPLFHSILPSSPRSSKSISSVRLSIQKLFWYPTVVHPLYMTQSSKPINLNNFDNIRLVVKPIELAIISSSLKCSYPHGTKNSAKNFCFENSQGLFVSLGHKPRLRSIHDNWSYRRSI